MLVRMVGILHGKETSMKIFTNELAAFTYYHMKGGFIVVTSETAQLPIPDGPNWNHESFAFIKRNDSDSPEVR